MIIKRNKIKELMYRGINSNELKLIGAIFMLIDHVAYYFQSMLPSILYTVCRGLGRIAMPIFVYTLVQGFFHTTNYYKYLKRIGICALITQIVVTILYVLNNVYFNEYMISIYSFGNILFSFVLILIILKLLHEKYIYPKWDETKNMWLRIAIGIVIIALSVLVPLDYGIEVIMLGVSFYLIERLRIYYNLYKGNINLIRINDEKVHLIYAGLILLALVVNGINYGNSFMTYLAIIPIFLYNFKKEHNYTKNKYKLINKYAFYLFFPIHHAVLYLLAMVLS